MWRSRSRPRSSSCASAPSCAGRRSRPRDVVRLRPPGGTIPARCRCGQCESQRHLAGAYPYGVPAPADTDSAPRAGSDSTTASRGRVGSGRGDHHSHCRYARSTAPRQARVRGEVWRRCAGLDIASRSHGDPTMPARAESGKPTRSPSGMPISGEPADCLNAAGSSAAGVAKFSPTPLIERQWSGRLHAPVPLAPGDLLRWISWS